MPRPKTTKVTIEAAEATASATTASATHDTPRDPHGPRRTAPLVTILGILVLGAVALFLTWDVGGHWDFALPRRGQQIAALAVVGTAIAVSTIIFQTLTRNRILTPSIMGFDALYVLLATALTFFLGSATAASLPPLATYAMHTSLMLIGATLLYRWILGDGSRGLYTLVLVGVIAGTFFSSLTSFMFRVMDPNEFDTLMSQLFASFNQIDTTLLGISSVLLIGGIAVAWRFAPQLDVLTLGRDRAITLGVDYQRTVTWLLMVVALLVAVSTALVGPITFLGLLVANLAYQLTRTHRHVINMAVAALVAMLALVLGQAVLEHVFHFQGTLGALINVVGGVYFIGLLLKEARS